jgi:cyanophycinase-like exopeptidase
MVILLTVAFIFALGVLVHITLLSRAKNWLEHQVLDMMPGYDFLKSMMEEKLHIRENNGTPVLVQWPASQQLGILIDEKDGRVVVFFPNGTIIGGGAIHVVDASQITRLSFSLTELDDILIRSGGGLLQQLDVSAGKAEN